MDFFEGLLFSLIFKLNSGGKLVRDTKVGKYNFVLVWIPWKAHPQSNSQGQVVYLGNDTRKYKCGGWVNEMGREGRELLVVSR